MTRNGDLRNRRVVPAQAGTSALEFSIRERQLRDLLHSLCVQWGFCIPPDDRERIATAQHLSADDFAREVLKAEGLNPEYEKQWSRKIRQLFINRFGQAGGQ